MRRYDERPNILLIMADQFRLKTLEGMGDGIRTPNIARLMEKSYVFTQSCCPAPLCTPSRAALATGRNPSRCGVMVHDAILPPEQETYYQRLRRVGYRVGVAGKSDLHKKDPFCGERGDTPAMYAYGFTDVHETEGKMVAALYREKSDGTKLLNGPYQHYLESKGLLGIFHEEYLRYQRERKKYYAAPSVLPQEDFEDEYIGRAATDYLRTVSDEMPWHYFVSFVGPHDPWDPPTEDYALYKDESFGIMQPYTENSPESKPVWVQARSEKLCGGMTGEDLINVKRCYAGSVNVVDRQVGRILQALKERGMDRNTWVIFTADHGEMLGEHGLIEKDCMYEGALRIPLIIHAPGQKSRTDIDSLASLMDLAPTILDLAGDHYDPKRMDAVSLLPVLTADRNSERPALREVQISELLNTQMLYDGRYKWIRSWNDIDELYDLENDPEERHNIIDEHPDVIARLRTFTFRK